MNIVKSFFAVSIFISMAIGLNGCGTLTKNNAPKNDACQCFWMENYSGQYKWVPFESIRATEGKITKTECYALDSCDGGLGHSGGGCYKWALGPENNRVPW